jgi:hypothetical protein
VFYHRLFPLQVARALTRAKDEFSESAPKVTDEKRKQYASRYQEQKAKVDRLVASLPLHDAPSP